MSKPKISVLVAAYNVEQYISKCLDSILGGTFKDIEIIVVDDGSTDDTGNICDQYAKDNINLRVIHQKNQGLSAVRNVGIEAAKGEYLTFIDGDDYVATNFLEHLVAALQDDIEIVVCGNKKMPAGEINSPAPQTISGEAATIELLTRQENYHVISCGKLYRRTLFQNIAFPLGRKNEDSFTTYKLFAQAKKIAFINEPLYFYVQRETSIMGSVKLNERLKNKMLAAREACAYFENQPKLIEAAKISELLATYSFIDAIIAGQLQASAEPHFAWLKQHAATLRQNPFLTRKLRIYLRLSTKMRGAFYKLFRKIKH